jgi:inosine-uridine nucleoside N-ribohydrolase
MQRFWIPCCVLSCALLWPILPASAQVPILLDTDIASDCDDAGAVAVLHALADRHEAQILGMGTCTLNRWAAPALDAINTYYGRTDIQIGSIKGELPGPTRDSAYTEYIAKNFPNHLRDGLKAPEVVSLYRQILSAQPDQSVVFVAIGWLRNLQNLLQSKPDRASSLSGRDLVAAKVRMLVDMGPKIDPPGIGWNFEQDPESAQYVVRYWPTPIMFSPKEVCWAMTGSRLKETPEANPVRKAYELWVAKNGHGRNTNHSADLTAVLFAIRGLRDYWTAETGGSLEVEPSGYSRWVHSPGTRQSYLVKKMAFDELARQLDELLIQPPSGKR